MKSVLYQNKSLEQENERIYEENRHIKKVIALLKERERNLDEENKSLRMKSYC